MMCAQGNHTNSVSFIISLSNLELDTTKSVRYKLKLLSNLAHSLSYYSHFILSRTISL